MNVDSHAWRFHAHTGYVTCLPAHHLLPACQDVGDAAEAFTTARRQIRALFAIFLFQERAAAGKATRRRPLASLLSGSCAAIGGLPPRKARITPPKKSGIMVNVGGGMLKVDTRVENGRRAEAYLVGHHFDDGRRVRVAVVDDGDMSL